MSAPKLPATRNIPELSIDIEGLRASPTCQPFCRSPTFPLKSDSYGNGYAIPLCPRLEATTRTPTVSTPNAHGP